MILPKVVKVMVCALGVLLLSSFTAPRTHTPKQTQPSLAFSRMVAFQIVLPDGSTDTVAVSEGQMARVGNDADGWQFGFIPFVKDIAGSSVQFDVFRIANDKAGNPSAHFMGTTNVGIGSKAMTGTDPNLQIQALQLAALPPQQQDSEAAPTLADAVMGPAGAPTSGRMVKLAITLPDGEKAEIGAAEGQMAKVGVTGRWEMGLVAFITDESQMQVHVDVFSIAKDQNGVDSPQFMKSIDIIGASQVQTATIPDIKIGVLSFGNIPKDLSAAAIEGDCRAHCGSFYSCGICAHTDSCNACCGDSLCCPIGG